MLETAGCCDMLIHMYSNTRYILYLVALSIVRAGRLFDEVFFQYQVPVQNYASLSCDHGVDHVRQPQHSVRGISNHFVYLFSVVFISLFYFVVLAQVLRPLLYQLDMTLLEGLVDKLRVQPADEVIEDTLTFIRDVAEATQQARQPTLRRSTFITRVDCCHFHPSCFQQSGDVINITVQAGSD